MRTHDEQPRRLERRLAAALRSRAVDVHYQPLVELLSHRPVGVEALARWDDARLGPVPPDVFVRAAERSGSIWQLGRQVLERAARTAAAWPDSTLVVDVNVSPRQLREPTFVAMVANALAAAQLEPSRLCLEITETAAVEDLALTNRRLAELRRLGVQVALDDFGTGYSSLTVLRDLAVDLVKMDRAFVSHLTSDARAAVLARLIIDAAHSMGMRVCAEGVETRGQAGQLLVLGCDLAQGWLFGRAMPDHDAGMDEVRRGIPLAAPIGEHEFEHALAGPEDLVVMTDPAGTVQFASAAALPLLGRSSAEMVGTSIADHLEPPDAAEGTWPLPDGTYRMVAKHPASASRRWIELTVRVSRDAERQVRRVVGVGRDVTAVVTAERQLAESESRFRRAFDEAPIGMAMTTLEGRFLRVNAAFADMLGRTPEAVMRTTVADLTIEEDRATDELNLAAVRRGEVHVHDVVKRYRHQDGRAVPAVVRAALVQGHGEQPPYILAHVLHDGASARP